MVKLLFEIWHDDSKDGWEVTLCLAGPDGDQARRLHQPSARLVHTFEAETHNEAMATRKRLMDWEEYRPEPSWPDEPRSRSSNAAGKTPAVDEGPRKSTTTFLYRGSVFPYEFVILER